jgi:predicted amidophosphoribosyltransferase
MKESHCESLTCSVGDLLCEWLRDQEAFSAVSYDCIVPIPQHWLRRLTQRYNQALTLGERLAVGLETPCSDAILKRRRWTQKQGTKTIIERRENLLDAFEVSRSDSVQFRSFLLIDDVMTSGATLHEAAGALKKAGARRVDAVVFARGVNASKAARALDLHRSLEDRLTLGQNATSLMDSSNEALRRKIH